ncbi:hypothetical protein P8452_61420 [Trifolium repens]|nr:hypothetical protein P8452_61420 [Trifolium repens]
MTMNNHVTEPINVLNCTDESFKMTRVSLNAPVQQHPLAFGLNAPIPFSNFLHGMNSTNYLNQEAYNHSWLPPSSSTQDKQG